MKRMCRHSILQHSLRNVTPCSLVHRNKRFEAICSAFIPHRRATDIKFRSTLMYTFDMAAEYTVTCSVKTTVQLCVFKQHAMKTLWGQWKYSNALISAPDKPESSGSGRPLRLQEAATGTYCRGCWVGPSVGPSVLLYIYTIPRSLSALGICCIVEPRA